MTTENIPRSYEMLFYLEIVLINYNFDQDCISA